MYSESSSQSMVLTSQSKLGSANSTLDTLGVVVVAEFASSSRHTALRAVPAKTTALTPLCRACKG